MAQFLGLENDHDHGDHDHGEAPQQTAAWNSALKGLSLKSLTQGLVITPNFLFLMLFLAFTGWLGVVYWVRHNEPFANAVLGSGRAYAPTAHADRRLLDGVREAMPFKTSPNTGKIYTPTPGPGPQPYGYQVPQAAAIGSIASPGLAPAQIPSAPALGHFAAPHSMRSYGNVPQYNPAPAPAPAAGYGWSLAEGGFSQESAHFMSQFGAPQALSPAYSHVYVPVATPTGQRLKVYTTR